MTLYNKLIPRGHRAMAQATDENRCSGRTTALKLRILAEAIDNPTKWVPVKDHYDDGISPTVERNKRFMGEIKALADSMGLRFIECRPGPEALIRSNHITDNPWEIE